MELVIQISAEEERRLREAADAKAVSPSDYAHRLLTQQLATTSGADQTLALLREWNSEDATEDSSELVERQRDWQELESALSRHPLALRRTDKSR